MSSATSLYNQSVPVLIRYLTNLSGLLTKATEHCEAKGVAPEDLLNAKLADDMKGIVFQVQSCSSMSKFLIHRLGVEAPVFADEETTFPQLQQRIQKTIAMLEGVKPDAFDGRAEAPVLMETARGSYQFENGQKYVSEYILPKFYFHASIAYAILRSQGVQVGLLDFIKGTLHMVQDDGSLMTL